MKTIKQAEVMYPDPLEKIVIMGDISDVCSIHDMNILKMVQTIDGCTFPSVILYDDGAARYGIVICQENNIMQAKYLDYDTTREIFNKARERHLLVYRI